MRSQSILVLAALAALAATSVVACSDDETTNPTTTTTTSATSGTGGGGTTTSTGAHGGHGLGGEGGLGGTGGTGAAGGNGGAGGSGGDMGGNGGSGGDGGGNTEVPMHGCTMATAEDLTGTSTVVITNGHPWQSVHQRCIKVSVGTTVTWQNVDPVLHPLRGGVQFNVDATSPITIAAIASTNTVNVGFAAAGSFPYFCTNHADMRGVVYVD